MAAPLASLSVSVLPSSSFSSSMIGIETLFDVSHAANVSIEASAV